jgi:hypothetical protein
MTNENEPRSPISSATDARPAAPAGVRPPYEPPRIVKKRSVSRATLFSGGGPAASGLGLTASG